jgi:hypothetical protein
MSPSVTLNTVMPVQSNDTRISGPSDVKHASNIGVQVNEQPIYEAWSLSPSDTSEVGITQLETPVISEQLATVLTDPLAMSWTTPSAPVLRPPNAVLDGTAGCDSSVTECSNSSQDGGLDASQLATEGPLTIFDEQLTTVPS